MFGTVVRVSIYLRGNFVALVRTFLTSGSLIVMELNSSLNEFSHGESLSAYNKLMARSIGCRKKAKHFPRYGGRHI